jgi:acetoacetate decarboxylase
MAGSFPANATRREMLRLCAPVGLVALASPNHAHSQDAINFHRVTNREVVEGSYSLPAHFGPVFKAQLGDTVYRDVTYITLRYRTEADKLRRYLPQPFELSDEAILNVSYSMNRQIDWLAGGQYNIVSVTTPAIFRGKDRHVSGDYSLVIWENCAEPILLGREQGFPKIYGDVQDHRVVMGKWRTGISHTGCRILDLHADGLTVLGAEECRAMEESVSPWLCWKYVPNELRTGPVLSYANVYPYSICVKEAWRAKGSVRWYPQTWEQNPTQHHIVNALENLPIEEVLSCVVWNGRFTLHTARVKRL